MKKKYEKPVLIIESFQLDATVAASCSSQGYQELNYNENMCGFEPGIDKQWQFFNYHNCDLDLTGPEGDGNDTVCYHGPIDASATFLKS